ncbi:hypothetical protein IE53DRAFT_180302 [Violaceomyces palustris]|uniref:Uncharacterized protein n=1 Tax=Violaceomyces palustris TaxID=1673888 RepID=A0ACD0NSL9_9BASI|nr:hypothetical protein IE53DRAFT_180302 [Violaceomyces palustris]
MVDVIRWLRMTESIIVHLKMCRFPNPLICCSRLQCMNRWSERRTVLRLGRRRQDFRSSFKEPLDLERGSSLSPPIVCFGLRDRGKRHKDARLARPWILEVTPLTPLLSFPSAHLPARPLHPIHRAKLEIERAPPTTATTTRSFVLVLVTLPLASLPFLLRPPFPKKGDDKPVRKDSYAIQSPNHSPPPLPCGTFFFGHFCDVVRGRGVW